MWDDYKSNSTLGVHENFSPLLEKGVAGHYFEGQDTPGQCPKGVSLSLTAHTGQVGRVPAHSQLWASGEWKRGRPRWWLLPREAKRGSVPGAWEQWPMNAWQCLSCRWTTQVRQAQPWHLWEVQASVQAEASYHMPTLKCYKSQTVERHTAQHTFHLPFLPNISS